MRSHLTGLRYLGEKTHWVNAKSDFKKNLHRNALGCFLLHLHTCPFSLRLMSPCSMCGGTVFPAVLKEE